MTVVTSRTSRKIGQVGNRIELTLDKYTTEFPELETENGKTIPLLWQKQQLNGREAWL